MVSVSKGMREKKWKIYSRVGWQEEEVGVMLQQGQGGGGKSPDKRTSRRKKGLKIT